MDTKKTMTEKSSRVTRIRFIVCALGVVSLALAQISRAVISYTITSMVDPKMLSKNQSVSSGGSCPVKGAPASEPLIEFGLVDIPEVRATSDVNYNLLIPNQLDLELIDPSEPVIEAVADKFMWTVAQQSLVKGGFFYSYFLFIIPGGRIAEIYGAKHVILTGILGSALINLATPWMARYNFPMLVASRLLMGVIQSAGFPAMYALISRWLTMSEASIFAPMLIVSLRSGQVLSSIVPGLIPKWPHIFYLVGSLCALWSAAWLLLATSDPSDNKWVSEAELAHIMANKRKKLEKEDKKSAPWLKIITSPPVIGLVIGKLAFSFCYSFITIELPSYLRYVYHISVQEMSSITTLVFSIQVAFLVVAGYLAKYMVQEHPFNLSTTAIRKLFQSLATIGTGLILVLIAFSDCNLTYVTVLLLLVSILAVFVAGGETMLPYDLSDEYPATIMAIANSVDNLSAVTVTVLTGLILGDEGGSQTGWSKVILVVAAADIFGGLMFCLLVKARRIDFSGGGEKKNNFPENLNFEHFEPVTVEKQARLYNQSLHNKPTELSMSGPELNRADFCACQIEDCSLSK